MLDKFKKLFKLNKEEKPSIPTTNTNVDNQTTKPKKSRKPKESKNVIHLSPKEVATKNNEPYISIVRVEIDPKDVNNGAFELDWNEKFVMNLIRAGYKIKESDTDNMIVDRWFQTVCRNIALEVYEQQQADPENRDVRVVRSKDLGNGRTEIS